MGTHPIFESDFDCLTESKNRITAAKMATHGDNMEVDHLDAGDGTSLPEGYYREVINHSDWIVPGRYSDLQTVGAGAYGSVCSSKDTQMDMSVAVKKLSRPFHSDIHAKRTYRELRLLKHFRHENVISMLNVFSSNEQFDQFNELYFVTLLMGSDRNNIIRTQRLTDDHVRFLTYQILRALKYIHSA